MENVEELIEKPKAEILAPATTVAAVLKMLKSTVALMERVIFDNCKLKKELSQLKEDVDAVGSTTARLLDEELPKLSSASTALDGKIQAMENTIISFAATSQKESETSQQQQVSSDESGMLEHHEGQNATPRQLIRLSVNAKRTYASAAGRNGEDNSSIHQVNSFPAEGFKTVTYQRSVKGTGAATGTQDGGDLISKLRLKTPPHRDFCVCGLPRDVSEKDVYDYVASLGVKVRFTEVHRRGENDRRGTTFARIGTYVAHEQAVLMPENWPENVSVRPWVYYANKKQQSDHPKN